jgi:hypothetical protein
VWVRIRALRTGVTLAINNRAHGRAMLRDPPTDPQETARPK